LKRNEALLEATLNTATEIVNTAVAQAEKYNVPRTAIIEMLTRTEALFDNMAGLGRPTTALQRQKALMLIQFARSYETLGDTTKQRQRAEEKVAPSFCSSSGCPPTTPHYRGTSLGLKLSSPR
jgi:hypothetical protein